MNVIVSALMPREDAWPLAELVQVGDVLRVRGRDRRVLQVSGAGPYVALVEYPLHVPVAPGEPVQVWRQAEANWRLVGGDEVSDEPAAYAAARAGAARSLREVEEEAAELGLGSLAAIAGWQAEQFERWTPFTAMLDSAFRRECAPPGPLGVCYAASFGWVHVRPGCRCPGR